MTNAAHCALATIIKLSGPEARLLVREHRYFLDQGTAEEAFSALRKTLDGFREAIAALERRRLVYAVFRNRQNISAGRFELSGTREIRIVPVMRGSKRAGILQTVFGVVLIVAATTATGGFAGIAAGGAWGAVGAAGVSIAAGSVVQMISPRPKASVPARRPKTSLALPSVAPRTPRRAVTLFRSATATGDGAVRSSVLGSTRRMLSKP